MRAETAHDNEWSDYTTSGAKLSNVPARPQSSRPSDLVWLVQERSPVLVQCHAGRSRSVMLVAGYLMQTEGYSVDQAIGLVEQKRGIAITPGIESVLAAL